MVFSKWKGISVDWAPGKNVAPERSLSFDAGIKYSVILLADR